MKSLSPERWRQIDTILEAVMDCPAEERESLLREQCGGDVELRREVEALLVSMSEAQAALGESVSEFAEPLVEDLREALEREEMEALPGGGRIGPYRLLQVIGRGGMGAVYLAERADDQFEKRVALKLVKRGMDTDEVLQRFRYERQILAALEHPNIGRLYDGGAAEDGRPYLVMEHIAGEPVTTYCDLRRLSIEARLRIFETICEAVQFAHRNLVIHRDLKPSNIMVTADGTVKLLDFGIAKLLDPSKPDLMPRTRTEMRLLTPEYASPEQADGAQVTTASDVYSLGVILFELLTGRRPKEERGRRTQDRFGLDTGRGRPSSTVVRPLRLSDERETEIAAAEVAARRGTTPERLRMRLRGDLDTITLKALADEPERRYQSAEQLLADVQRYRRGMPVSARGESFGYRTTKFVRRHRVVVSFSVALTLLLSGFVATTFRQNQLLQARQEQAENVIGYIFDDLRPKLVAIASTELLEDAAMMAEEYFVAVPPSQLSDNELSRRTEHMRVLGDVRLQRGDWAGALGSFQDAHSLGLGLLERDPTNSSWRLGVATDHFWLGDISFRRGDLAGALEHFEAYRDHARYLVEAHPDSLGFRLELSYAHGNVGTVLENMGDRDGALREYLLTLDQKKSLAELEPGNPEFQAALAVAYNKVGVAEQQRGNLPAALQHYREELAVRQVLASRQETDRPARRNLSRAHIFLGELLFATGDAAAALEHRLAAWRIDQELVQWDSANTDWQSGRAISGRFAGLGLVHAGQRGDGVAALEESCDILRRLVALVPENAGYRRELADSESALASALVEEDPSAAAAAATRGLEALEPLAGTSEQTAGARITESRVLIELGRALAALGRGAEADDAWAQALQVLEPISSQEAISRSAARATALLYLGRTTEAQPLAEALLASGFHHPRFVSLLASRGLSIGTSR